MLGGYQRTRNSLAADGEICVVVEWRRTQLDGPLRGYQCVPREFFGIGHNRVGGTKWST